MHGHVLRRLSAANVSWNVLAPKAATMPASPTVARRIVTASVTPAALYFGG